MIPLSKLLADFILLSGLSVLVIVASVVIEGNSSVGLRAEALSPSRVSANVSQTFKGDSK